MSDRGTILGVGSGGGAWVGFNALLVELCKDVSRDRAEGAWGGGAGKATTTYDGDGKSDDDNGGDGNAMAARGDRDATSAMRQAVNLDADFLAGSGQGPSPEGASRAASRRNATSADGASSMDDASGSSHWRVNWHRRPLRQYVACQ